MQTTPKPISTKSPRKTKNAARFLLEWAAVIALALVAAYATKKEQ